MRVTGPKPQLLLTIGVLIGLVAFLSFLGTLENQSKMWAFSLALVVGSFLLITFFLKPLTGVLIYFALYPTLILFNDVRVAIPGSSASFAFSGIVQTVILVCGAMACFRKGYASLGKLKALHFCFLAFVLWMLVTMAVNSKSLDMLAAFKELARIVSVYVLFLVGFKYSKGEGDIRKLVVALGLSLIVPIGFSLFQLVHGTQYLQLENYNRVMGTFGIPNMYAMYLLLPLALFLVFALNRKVAPDRRMLTATFCVFLLVILFFTYTRASWLGFVILTLFLGIKKYKRLIPYIVVVLLVLLAGFSLEALRLGTQTGSSGRLHLWSALVAEALKHPVFGHGFTTMASVTKTIFGTRNQGQNQFLLYAVEGGVLGTTLFLLLIAGLYRKCAKAFQGSAIGLSQDLGLAFRAFLLATFVVAFFESNAVFQNWVWLPAGIFLGASLSASRNISINPRQSNTAH